MRKRQAKKLKVPVTEGIKTRKVKKKKDTLDVYFEFIASEASKVRTLHFLRQATLRRSRSGGVDQVSHWANISLYSKFLEDQYDWYQEVLEKGREFFKDDEEYFADIKQERRRMRQS